MFWPIKGISIALTPSTRSPLGKTREMGYTGADTPEEDGVFTVTTPTGFSPNLAAMPVWMDVAPAPVSTKAVAGTGWRHGLTGPLHGRHNCLRLNYLEGD